MDPRLIRICNACGAHATINDRFCPKCANLSLTKPTLPPVTTVKPDADETGIDLDEDDEEFDDDGTEDMTPREKAEYVLGMPTICPMLQSGAPSRYEWWSEAKEKFTIEYDRWNQSRTRWVLAIDGQAVGGFLDEIAAMEAVFRFKTGHARWDALAGKVKSPSNGDDWTSN